MGAQMAEIWQEGDNPGALGDEQSSPPLPLSSARGPSPPPADAEGPLDLGQVRRLLDDMTTRRFRGDPRLWDQRRYDVLCRLERELLSQGASGGPAP